MAHKKNSVKLVRTPLCIIKPVQTNLINSKMNRIVHHLSDKLAEPSSAIDQLKSYLKTSDLREGDRLPPERELAVILSVTRGALRQALAVLEASGEVWRRVGKGTFIGSNASRPEDDLMRQLARTSNPVEVIEARLVLEPKLAAFAALRGTDQNFAEISRLLEECKAAQHDAQAQKLGDEFHYAIARAANNSLLFALFETLFQVRAKTSWGRLRPALATKKGMIKVWRDHEQILDAIKMRDPREAAHLMHIHIENIQKSIALGYEPSQGKAKYQGC